MRIFTTTAVAWKAWVLLALFGGSVAMASPEGQSKDQGLQTIDRAILANYARDTWHAIATLADGGALPADALRKTQGGWVVEGLTSPTNLAAYLWSIMAAEDLELIQADESGRRLEQALAAIGRLERSHGFFYNWYEPATGRPAVNWPGGGKVRPFLSVVDNGWLAAALMLVGNTRPGLHDTTEALLKPMDFAFFYDAYDPRDPTAHPGLLRGGYWPDAETYAGFHYGALNTEPRIASYIGIARGQVPPEHYYRMFRTNPTPPAAMLDPSSGGTILSTSNPTSTASTNGAVKYAGVLVNEGTFKYRGIELVPTWDGTMFEALMVSLLVPEADWAPRSWGANHPLYVRAQIEYGLNDARLGYWGLSAAATPGGGYGAYGVAALGVRTHAEQGSRPREAVIAPYASFLAMPFAPAEALANLKGLADHFPAIYGPYGFLDSVDVVSGQVADRVLILDQGMILASLVNVIGKDSLRRGFCAGAVESSIKPLIAEEQFDSRFDAASTTIAEPVHGEITPVLASLASAPDPSGSTASEVKVPTTSRAVRAGSMNRPCR